MFRNVIKEFLDLCEKLIFKLPEIVLKWDKTHTDTAPVFYVSGNDTESRCADADTKAGYIIEGLKEEFKSNAAFKGLDAEFIPSGKENARYNAACGDILVTDHKGINIYIDLKGLNFNNYPRPDLCGVPDLNDLDKFATHGIYLLGSQHNIVALTNAVLINWQDEIYKDDDKAGIHLIELLNRKPVSLYDKAAGCLYNYIKR